MEQLFLHGLWYMALPGRDLRPGQMRHKTLLDEPLLFARTRDGEPFAVRDICPHRGIPLSHGSFDGDEVECPYHGWRFNREGRCTAIPSLVEEQDFDINRIKVQRYPCRESQGMIWVYMGAPVEDTELPPIPFAPDVGDGGPALIESQIFPCDIDHAVIGLMDPAHGPFVHRSWWWRSKKSMHEKAKAFAPSHLGFTMVRHKPSANSGAYKILGGEITTEISFQLPGVRIEHIKAGRHTICGITSVTPLTRNTTEVTTFFYWTLPLLTLLRPMLQPFARKFLGQDREIVEKQQQGLKHDPTLMLIKDADTQARWYHRLKKEWVKMGSENRPFENPVKETTLRWRS